jgi:hypothetical protein
LERLDVFHGQTKGNRSFLERGSAMRGVALSIAAVLLGLALVVPARQASALDVDKVLVYQGTDRHAGAVTDYFFGIEVLGTGVADITVTNDCTPTVYNLTNWGGNHWGISRESFGTGPLLLAAHPVPNNYRFFINQISPGKYQDNVALGFNQNIAGGYVNITYPLNNATGVPLNPTYTWDNAQGLGHGLFMWVNKDNDAVYEKFPELDMTKMSWQPGPLASGTQYELEVAVGNWWNNLTGPLSTQTKGGDAFTYYGIRGQDNRVDFTTIPEPVSAMLVGTATLTLVGLRRRRRMK